MENGKEVVESLEKLVDMIPDLSEAESQKVFEIKEMLDKIKKNVEKEND